ncbi:UPF0005-domain-containing protein [Ascobolus immersus RN42]|uniref:UPF0005-domain-containing protein n=1 Tax=Ascobolus immersus RN42 TaxID=1160509 RepID=A0A3N4ICY2_ASCIM|nr:UPF0005-domain-containing protein [Ascobolus immersus RN42]
MSAPDTAPHQSKGQPEPYHDVTAASNSLGGNPPPYADDPERRQSHEPERQHYGATDPLMASYGMARASLEDGLPSYDDDKTFVSEATVNIRMAFIRKVYAILSVQLMATVILSSFSFFSTDFRNWIQTNQWMMWTSVIGSFAFLFLTMWKSKSYPINLLFLSGFTLLEAYTVALVVSFYEVRIVIQALLLTLGIFVALTLFACQTKYDFTGLGPYLFGFLAGAVVFSFISMFFPYNSTLDLVYSGGVAILFSGYILYDTQMIMKRYHADEEVAAAMSLYLDVLNLFLAILRILNSQNDD